MAQRIAWTPAGLESLRHDCVETNEPLWSIARRRGLHESTVMNIMRRQGWPMRSQRVRQLLPLAAPAAPPPVIVGGAPASAASDRTGAALTPGDDVPLAERVQRQVEQALAATEHVLPQLAATPAHPGAERAARTLASLVKTLHELRRLRAAEMPAAAGPDAEDRRDYDQLRQELVESLERLAAEPTDPLPDGA